MRVVDLSVPLYTGMPVFPGDPEVKITLVHTHQAESWELRQLSLGSHSGTHVDAFSHMHQGKQTLDEIPLDRFFGQAQVVAVSETWPDKTGLFFTEEVGEEVLKRILESNPGFVGGNITENLEQSLLGNGIVTYTGLVNLETLPKGERFMFYGLPLKIKSGDGSPVRAIAILTEIETAASPT